MSCGVGHTRDSDPILLWCRPPAVAPIQPLAWEPTYAAGSGPRKRQKYKKKKKKDLKQIKMFEKYRKIPWKSKLKSAISPTL